MDLVENCDQPKDNNNKKWQYHQIHKMYSIVHFKIQDDFQGQSWKYFTFDLLFIEYSGF